MHSIPTGPRRMEWEEEEEEGREGEADRAPLCGHEAIKGKTYKESLNIICILVGESHIYPEESCYKNLVYIEPGWTCCGHTYHTYIPGTA